MTQPVSNACEQTSAVFAAELRANGVDCTWLAAQLLTLTSRASLVRAYVAAGRKYASVSLTLSSPTSEHLAALSIQGSWSQKDAARACLLLHFVASAPVEEHEPCVRDLFYKGDSEERHVVLRCLSLLPTPERYALVATDAVRSHVQTVFEAIACENPYPQCYLDTPAFNQVVMKAYFTGVAVQRIVGLLQRRNPELQRMALDFAAERRAAGRPVPADLDLVTTP